MDVGIAVSAVTTEAGNPDPEQEGLLNNDIHDDISNDANYLTAEVVNTQPKRGRQFGSTVKNKAIGGVKKGRENKNKAMALAPFEKEGPLTREDVRCSICMSIYIEPVTLPCKHCLCLECYRSSMEKATLCCPICRFRLSNWGRKNIDNLINKEFWERIQTQFREAVDARLEGQDSQTIGSYESPIKPSMRDGFVAQEGEIKKELENIQKQHDQDLENEKRREAEASSELIRQLQEEEGPPPPSPSQLLRDFEMAMKMQEEERQATGLRALSASRPNQSISSVSRTQSAAVRSRPGSNPRKRGNSSVASTSCTPNSIAFKRICTTDSQSKQNKITSFFEPTLAPRSRSGTPDSINLEFSQHFQPIAPAPKTPPKKNSDGSVEELVFVKSRPVRRDLSIDFGILSHEASTTLIEPKDQVPTEIPLQLGKPERLILPRELGIRRENEVDAELHHTKEFEEPLESADKAESDHAPLSGTVQEILTVTATRVELDVEVGNANENASAAESHQLPRLELGTTNEFEQLPNRIELELGPTNEYEYGAQLVPAGRQLELPNIAAGPPVRSVEYYREHIGSSDSVVMGSSSEDDDWDQPRYPGLECAEDEPPRPVRSPFPSDDSVNSSEYEFNLSSPQSVENAKAMARLKQEEEDRKFALKLQRELNKPVVIREKYELRVPDRTKVKVNYAQNSSATSTNSTASNVTESSSSENVRSRKPTRMPSGSTKKPSTIITSKASNTANLKTLWASNSKPSTSTNAKPSNNVDLKNLGGIIIVKPSTSTTAKASTRANPKTSNSANVASATSASGKYELRKKANVNYILDTSDSETNSVTKDQSTPRKNLRSTTNLQPSDNDSPLEPRRKSARQRRRPRRFSSSSSSGSSTGVAVGTPSR